MERWRQSAGNKPVSRTREKKTISGKAAAAAALIYEHMYAHAHSVSLVNLAYVQLCSKATSTPSHPKPVVKRRTGRPDERLPRYPRLIGQIRYMSPSITTGGGREAITGL